MGVRFQLFSTMPQSASQNNWNLTPIADPHWIHGNLTPIG